MKSCMHKYLHKKKKTKILSLCSFSWLPVFYCVTEISASQRRSCVSYKCSRSQEATEAIQKSVSLWLPQLQAADKGNIDEENFDPIEVSIAPLLTCLCTAFWLQLLSSHVFQCSWPKINVAGLGPQKKLLRCSHQKLTWKLSAAGIVNMHEVSVARFG